MLIFVGVVNIVCCVFDNSVVFNGTVEFRSFVFRWFVRSFTLGVVRSKVVHGGAFGRWRGSRYQPTEGTGMSARLELYSSYFIVPSSLGD